MKKKKQKKEGGERGKAMTSTEIIICSAFEFVKKPPLKPSQIKPVTIHEIESNQPYIDLKILHTIELKKHSKDVKNSFC